jgi:glycosyltransferase 2 family protein
MRVGARSWPVLLALLAGLGGLVWVVLAVGPAPVLESIGRLGWLGFSAVVAFHLGIIVVLGVAWWFTGPEQAPVRAFVFGRYVRDSVGESLPLSQVGGFLVGARALVLGGAGGLFAAASTLVDLTAEACAKLPYTVIGLGLLVWDVPGRYAWVAGGLALAIVLAPALAILWLQWHGGRWVERAAGLVASRMSGKWRFDPALLQLEITRLYRQRRAVFSAFLVHTVAWLLSGVELWITLHFMGRDLSMAAAIVIDSLLNGVRGIAFIVPGALGLQEMGYVAFGALFALSPDEAVALSLIRRGRDMAYGIPGVLLWQAVEGRRLQRS